MELEQVDLSRLEEAIVIFYQHSTQQVQVHEWLTKVQCSPQAWSFAWQLLQPGKSQEIQFFGAVTLHSKLLKHWSEVPKENYEELKQKLLETIVVFAANGPKIVLNRLCIALSAYIVHMLGEWPTAIEDIISTFQQQQIPNVSAETQLWIMIEILQGIPEETNIIFTSVKRATLRAEVAKRSPLIMKTTEEYLNLQFNKEWTVEVFTNMTRTVKCIEIWMRHIGYPLEHCFSIADILLKITNKCYWPCMTNPDSDCCMSAEENELAETSLKTLFLIIIQPDAINFPKAAFILIKMFLDSLCDITKSEWKEENNNEDIVVNIYTLFVSSIERHAHFLQKAILYNEPEYLDLYNRLVNQILMCSDKPGIYPVEESCSNLAMDFWYLLQDEVFSMQNTEEKMKCWDYIKPLYAHLTRIFIRKAQQPDEITVEKFTADDLESFRCYRQDISDTLMYCYDVLHGDILMILIGALQEAVLEVQNECQKKPKSKCTSWTQLEAVIYCFHAIAEHIDNAEKVYLPKLIQVLAEIPYEKMDSKILGTALETVGAYCMWFKENPEYLGPAIELLVKGLGTPMSTQSTLGLKEISRDCQIQMKPFAQPILNACQSSIASGSMKNSDCIRLMFTVGKMMSLLNVDDITTYLDLVVGPCFEELQTICQSGNRTPSARIRTVYRLNMISTLFSSLNIDLEDDDCQEIQQPVQPVLIVMQKTMPIFRQIAEIWFTEVEVLEASCSSLKHAILNLQLGFKPMLLDLAYFIVAIFQVRCCPPSLDLAKTAIILFYKDESVNSMMQQLLVEFSTHTFKLFDQVSDADFSNISEIIEMFYACLTSIVKKMPQALVDQGIDLTKMVNYALKAMTLPECGPIRTSVQFLTNFISQSRKYPSMTQIIYERGEEIIKTAVLCVGFVSPRQQVDKFADIFLSINKKYPAELASWIKVLATPMFPTELVDESDKSKFMQQIIREKTNKRLLQTHLHEFATKSRGLAEKL